MKTFQSFTRFRTRSLRPLGIFALLGQFALADREISVTGSSPEGDLPVINGDTSASEPHLFFGIVDSNASLRKRYTVTNKGNESLRIYLRDDAPGCSSPEFRVSGFPDPDQFDYFIIPAKQTWELSVTLSPTSQFPSGIVTLKTNATDPDDRTFTFPVAGRGNLGRAGVFHRPFESAEREILFGDESPSSAEGTNFGSVLISHPVNDNPVNEFATKSLSSGPGDTLVIKNAMIVGPDSDAFDLFNLGGTLEQGSEQLFSIRFNPESVGEKNATLTFNTNEPGRNPFTFALKGKGITAPGILVEGRRPDAPYGVIDDGATLASFNNGTAFGGIAVNGTVDRTIRITNHGDGDLVLAGPVATGDFEILSFPTSPLAPGASSEHTLRFKPTSPGLKTGQISFQTNIAGMSVFNFTITGTGTGPRLTLENRNANGDYVTIAHDAIGRSLLGGPNTHVAVPGEPTVSGAFRITNSGNRDLVISNKSILDEGSEQFAFQGLSNGLTLAEGESEEFMITLDATTVGDTRVTVRIFSNALPTPYCFELRSRIIEGSEIAFFGRPADGEFTPVVSGAALSSLENGTAFPTLAEGETSVTSTFRFTNEGDNDLLVSLQDPTGRDAAEFSVSPLGSETLAPGASQDFTITLTPTSTSNRIAQFHLVTNDPLRRDFTFPLLGNVPRPPASSPEAKISAFVMSGTEAGITFLSEPGIDYRLRYSPSLEGRSWQDVPGVGVIHGSATPQILRILDLIDLKVPGRFYRIEEVPSR
ncbi:choice-of-anchor D domain-containing protein [Verrucomicrobiaceae bacterium 227]